MPKPLLYPIGKTDACRHAAAILSKAGIQTIDHPAPEVTHLLLDIRPGAEGNLDLTLSMLPPGITVIGGMLNLPDYIVWDFLKDEHYLARNAAITAECALKVALPMLQATLDHTPTLIIGWGRIGKCLAKMLKALSCPISVAARKPSDRAMLSALGYQTQDTAHISLKNFRLLFNTAPEPILSEEDLAPYPDLIKIELASKNGIFGPDVIPARGLPGKYAPESSGRLIAETILRHI